MNTILFFIFLSAILCSSCNKDIDKVNYFTSRNDTLIIKTEKINAKKAVFQKLLYAGLIDKEFYKIAKLNVEYFNGYQLVPTIYDTWQLPVKIWCR